MNEHTPKAVIKAVHCKRLARNAKLIAQTKKLAEIKAAQEAKEQKMNKYIVCYYDTSPTDPQDRLTTKRETVLADNEQMAEEIMVNSGKEVIDVEPVETIANLVHSAYGEALEDDPQRDAETQARDVEKFGWYEIADGTEPSPIISGGEVLYPSYPKTNDEMPF